MKHDDVDCQLSPSFKAAAPAGELTLIYKTSDWMVPRLGAARDGGIPVWRALGKTARLESQAPRKVLKPKLWTLTERNLRRKRIHQTTQPLPPIPPHPSSYLQLNPAPLRHGVPATCSEPLAGPAQPCFPVGRPQERTGHARLAQPGRQDSDHHAEKWIDGTCIAGPWPIGHNPGSSGRILTRRLACRWPPSTRRGPRRRRSAFGSTPARGQRRTRRTAPRTSSSTWPSRYAFHPDL